MDWATYLVLCALLVGVFLGAFVAAGRMVAPRGREGPARRRARKLSDAGPTTTLDGTG